MREWKFKMEMFYFILKIGYAAVVIPDTYTKEECQLLVDKSYSGSLCIPAPAKNPSIINQTNSVIYCNKIDGLVVCK